MNLKTQVHELTLEQDVRQRLQHTLAQLEHDINTSEKRFCIAAEQATVGICHCDLKGRFLWVNTALCQMLGYSAPELLATNFEAITHPQDRPSTSSSATSAIATPSFLRCTLKKRYLSKSGAYVWAEVTLSPVQDNDGNLICISAIVQDISQRRQSEEQLRESLQEKEILLAEIHHRVKNNLQIISSLLELQASRLDDNPAQDILLASKNRILAMSLIHENLYHSDNLARIDFADYVRTLAQDLFRAYCDNAESRLIFDLQPCQITDNDTAISLGLILNELVTNAIKYGTIDPAVAPYTPLTLKVELGHWQQDGYRLAVSHDGPPLSPDFTARGERSIGLTLIRRLVQKVGGQLTITPAPWVTFAVTFSP